MEKILSIKELTERRPYSTSLPDWANRYEGYAITTDSQIIKLLIDADQSCCENWGYFMSQDNFDDFIGAELLKIDLVDEVLNVTPLVEASAQEAVCMFVNIHTSKGVLQFVAYNDHNGYYGHEAIVESTMLTHNETL